MSIRHTLESLSDIWIFLWYIGLPLLKKELIAYATDEQKQ